MKLRLLALLIILGLGFALPAAALELHDARAQGLVGEQLDGYVAALKDTPDVKGLAATVNAKRKTEYARISATNKQPVDVVAKLAAEEIIKGLPAGSLYQGPGGWQKR